MSLSNNVVSQFVKITNDYRKKEDNTKAYGKVVIYEDQQYVQLDGSDLLTPVDSTVHVKDNERVTVTIKDHNALIDGNTSDISASNQALIDLSSDLVKFKVDTEGMFLEVRDEFDEKMTQFKVTVDGMFLEVNNKVDDKFAQFQVTVDGMFLQVNNKIDNKFAEFQVTVDGMFVQVNNRVSATEQNIASLSVTANQIQSEVSKKVDGSQVGTIVTQNAESWGISINGKLKGTNYTFDGNNFTIGSTTGNTTAYHASGYSKWVHSDGSYTRIDANGLTWSKGGTSSTYHYLLYAGEYRCQSEETRTIQLPEEFIGKNFKVVTSIKRIYVSNNEYVTGCMFPLLSFYAEALNINRNTGTFQVYASIRAWNRTGYSNWGTMIGNGTTAAEKEAIQPVVAYWAFV